MTHTAWNYRENLCEKSEKLTKPTFNFAFQNSTFLTQKSK
jgi:hypothetical protein